MPDKRAMSDKHEQDTAEALGGYQTRGSGNQWAHKGDVAAGNHLDDPWALLVECKATAGQSISVSWAWLEKILGEANGERPVLALRYYEGDDRLTVRPHGNWWLFEQDDALELLEAAKHPLATINAGPEWSPEEVEEFQRKFAEAMASGAQPEAMALVDDETAALRAAVDQFRDQEVQLRARVANQKEIIAAREKRVAELEQQLAAAARQEDEPPPVTAPGVAPAPLPQVPWMVIYQHQLPGGGTGNTGVFWDEHGHQHPVGVNTVRVEPAGVGKYRLMVNDQIVRAGDLYINGKHQVRVGR